ncbi:MAG: hypothetical protein ACOVNP_00855 [Flavobacterium sp.]
MSEFESENHINPDVNPETLGILHIGGESNEWKTLEEIPSDPFSSIINDLKSNDISSMNLDPNPYRIPYDEDDWKIFIDFLGKKMSKYLPITFPESAQNNKKLSNADKIRMENSRKKKIEAFTSIDSGFSELNGSNIGINKTRVYNNPMSSVFFIIRWAINMYKHIDDNYHPSINNLIVDCICSISRMRQDIVHFPPYILCGVDELIKSLMTRFYKRISSKDEERFNKIMKVLLSDENEELLLESTWERIKYNAKELYSEQKEVLNHLRNALNNDQNTPLFATYKVSPGSGKTFLSAVLAAFMQQEHTKNNHDDVLSRAIREGSCVTIPETHVMKGNQKMLLYSCYNVQVRNMVAKLCIDTDIPFMLASSYTDSENVVHTTLRPHKTMYENYRSHRKVHNPMKFGTLDEQWLYYMENVNRLPAIIISDLQSCSVLLDKYSERFVGYFDEVTAGAEEGTTSEFAQFMCDLLKKAPRQTILLSATVQDISQLDWCIQPFIARHSAPIPEYSKRIYDLPSLRQFRPVDDPHDNEDIKRKLHIYLTQNYGKALRQIERMDITNKRSKNYVPVITSIASSRLNISCTAYVKNEANEYISYMPHMRLTSINELSTFVERLKKDNALIRFYSPEAVYYLVTNGSAYIPEKYKFENYFEDIGLIRHSTIRNYIIELFENMVSTNNIELFNSMRTYVRSLLSENDKRANVIVDQSHILTSNAYLYDRGKMIQVYTSSGLDTYVNTISAPLLEGSPSIRELLTDYAEQKRIRDEKVEAVKARSGKSGGDETSASSYKRDTKDSLEQRRQQVFEDNIPKFKYPQRYLVNSTKHCDHFAPHTRVRGMVDICLTEEDMKNYLSENVSDTYIKLAMSGIAVRNVANMCRFEKQMYEKNIRSSKMFISDPSIVYGTNIKSVNTVSISAEYASSNNSTRNSIYQLMGRAGRSGQSSSARILFHSMEGIDKLFGDENYEANIMRMIATQFE